MSLNKVMLMGEIAEEPKVYYQTHGVPTVNVTLNTVTPSRMRPNGTVIPEVKEWHSIWLWDDLARIAETQLHKGDQLFVEGTLHTRAYNDRSGTHHVRAEIWATGMEIVWSKTMADNKNASPKDNATEQILTNGEPSNKIPF